VPEASLCLEGAVEAGGAVDGVMQLLELPAESALAELACPFFFITMREAASGTTSSAEVALPPPTAVAGCGVCLPLVFTLASKDVMNFFLRAFASSSKV
jgi:hypothetical protein